MMPILVAIREAGEWTERFRTRSGWRTVMRYIRAEDRVMVRANYSYDDKVLVIIDRKKEAPRG